MRIIGVKLSEDEYDWVTHAADLRGLDVLEYTRRAINLSLRKEGVDAVLLAESDDDIEPVAADQPEPPADPPAQEGYEKPSPPYSDEYHLAMAALDHYDALDDWPGAPTSTSIIYRIHQLGHALQMCQRVIQALLTSASAAAPVNRLDEAASQTTQIDVPGALVRGSLIGPTLAAEPLKDRGTERVALDLEPICRLARQWSVWSDVRTPMDFAICELARGSLALIAEIERLHGLPAPADEPSEWCGGPPNTASAPADPPTVRCDPDFSARVAAQPLVNAEHTPLTEADLEALDESLRRIRTAPADPPKPPMCEWASIEDEETGDYETACGHAFQSLDGDRPDFITYCCYCGQRVAFAAAEPPKDEP